MTTSRAFKFSGKRVLITGGCGFIGSHLVRHLAGLGADVKVLQEEGRPCTRLEKEKRVAVARCDLSKAAAVEEVVEKFRPHYIFSLAAKILRGVNSDFLPELFDTHVKNLAHVLSAAEKDKELIRLVHVGTIDEYGKISAPFREDARENPQNPYAVTKLMGTRLVQHTAQSGTVPAVVVRLALTYGPGQRDGMFVPDFVRSCMEKKNFPMTQGEQTRDFLFVADAVDGLVAAAATEGIVGEIINIGSGQQIQLKEAAERINALAGNPIEVQYGAIPYRADENMEYWLDTKKAQKLLNWNPQTSLSEGLRATIVWYKKHQKSL